MLILSIQYIVKRLTFMPPNPPKYKIVKNIINNEEKIYFLLKSEKTDSKYSYKEVRPRHFCIKYKKIFSSKNNKYIPILIISPIIDFNICIIYCQGNSGDLGASLFECHEMAIKCSATIVTFEYPGYGICKGDKQTESEFFERIKIIYLFVLNDLGYKPERIFLYGFSLGTGIVFDFACKKEFPVSGMILQSPFLSIFRTRYNTKKTKYFDLFNNCDKAKNLKTNTLFIHGNKDKVVPYVHGRILAKLIPEKYFYDFLTVDDREHNNLLKGNKDAVFKYVNMFISDCILDAKQKRKFRFNNYLINYNWNKKIFGKLKSENVNLNNNENSKEIRIFGNEKTISNTYNNFKIKEISRNSNKHLRFNNYNDTINNHSSYLIESNNFKIINNSNNSSHQKSNNKKDLEDESQFSNNYYHIDLGTNSQLKKRDKFNPIYKKNKENKNNNKSTENNCSEIYNSKISINSSNMKMNNK